MSRVMRKQTFCLCENKDAEADQRLCFRHIDSTIPLLYCSKSEISSLQTSSVHIMHILTRNLRDLPHFHFFSMSLIYGEMILCVECISLSS